MTGFEIFSRGLGIDTVVCHWRSSTLVTAVQARTAKCTVVGEGSRLTGGKKQQVRLQ